MRTLGTGRYLAHIDGLKARYELFARIYILVENTLSRRIASGLLTQKFPVELFS
jgi:hypothetical protein